MFWNRTRREIGLMPTALQPPAIAMCPYLDTELYSFLSGLKPDVLGVNAIHDEAFKLAFGQYQDIPFAPYGTKRSAVLHYAKLTIQTLLYCHNQRINGHSLAATYLHNLMSSLLKSQKNSRALSPTRLLYNIQLRHLVQSINK